MPEVRVGVAAILSREGPRGVEFLLGERHGSHGAGKWALPGGHLEMGEAWVDCATRELKEETGLDISNWTTSFISNDHMESEEKHYITIFLESDVRGKDLDPKLLEPNKCKGWEWLTVDDIMRKKLFLPMEHLMYAYQTGTWKPFEKSLPSYGDR